MSVMVMSAVWNHSRAKGTDRLVLLAIADHAHDDGTGAWPSNTMLQGKTHLSERAIRDCVRRLEHLGEIRTERRVGRGRANLYTVKLPGIRYARDALREVPEEPVVEPVEEPVQEEIREPIPVPEAPPESPSEEPAEPENRQILPGLEKGQVATEKGQISSVKGAAAAPEPRTNHQEPSGLKPVAAPLRGRQDVPVTPGRARDPVWDALVELYGPPPQAKHYRTTWGLALQELHAQGATEGEVHDRVTFGRIHKAWAVETPGALAKYWGIVGIAMAAGPEPPGSRNGRFVDRATQLLAEADREELEEVRADGAERREAPGVDVAGGVPASAAG